MKTAKDARVCLIGNLCIDIVIRDVDTLPEWGRETAGHEYRVVASGQTSYTALALRSLGVPVDVVGYVGADDWGRLITRTLTDAGVGVDGIETLFDAPTALTIAAVRPDGERAFLSDYACLERGDESVIERHHGLLSRAAALALLGSFSFPGLNLPAAAGFLLAAKRRGAPTLLDTGWDPAGFGDESVASVIASLPAVSHFLPNEEEARACAGGRGPEAAADYFRECGAETVVVKLGSSGCYAADADERLREKGFPVEAVDSVGAGDVFNAGLLFGLLAGYSLKGALRIASAAAALRVQHGSGFFPTIEQVEDFIRKRGGL